MVKANCQREMIVGSSKVLPPTLFVCPAGPYCEPGADSEVDGASFHPQRRLTEGLRKRRVSMHGHPELLRGPLDELGVDALGYEVGNVGAYGVHAQDQARLLVHDYLDESSLL